MQRARINLEDLSAVDGGTLFASESGVSSLYDILSSALTTTPTKPAERNPGLSRDHPRHWSTRGEHIPLRESWFSATPYEISDMLHETLTSQLGPLETVHRCWTAMTLALAQRWALA